MSKFYSTCSSEDNPIDFCSWETHFFSLFSEDPPPIDTKFRSILLGHFTRLDHAKYYIIVTPASIQAHICRLMPGKASGSDGLQSNHLVYGTVELFEHLAILFKACTAKQHIPDVPCEGLVTCILKKNKNPKLCDAFTITVCLTIGKLLEKLI